ncbi:MarR family winged helix-turn-helix transcriptional regulator [Pontivivens ytuae]|uniref:MarR family transcriptional regulator n=1 Tax=Pontivivens ytuae TaxID=2789856 RepID=A0A7S9QC13_9RHOB|nr:MarR family transcriptional regulator [Pontivivens ytuae]QPH53345.1 MarR family transcriptional regulator [Pontivivens ytuae]
MPSMILSLWQQHAALHYSFAAYAARRMKIGLAEVACLEQLQVNGPLTPGEIGARLHMPSGSITALIDRLEHKGMIERTPSRNDRRSYSVSLAAGAWKAAELDLIPMAGAIDAIANELSPAERQAVERFLESLNAELAAHCGEK